METILLKHTNFRKVNESNHHYFKTSFKHHHVSFITGHNCVFNTLRKRSKKTSNIAHSQVNCLISISNTYIIKIKEKYAAALIKISINMITTALTNITQTKQQQDPPHTTYTYYTMALLNHLRIIERISRACTHAYLYSFSANPTPVDCRAEEPRRLSLDSAHRHVVCSGKLYIDGLPSDSAGGLLNGLCERHGIAYSAKVGQFFRICRIIYEGFLSVEYVDNCSVTLHD